MTKSKSKYASKYPKFKPAQAWIRLKLWLDEELLGYHDYPTDKFIVHVLKKMEELEIKT